MDMCLPLKVLWKFTAGHVFKFLYGQGVYINNLEENVEALELALEELREIRDDVLGEVTEQEKKGFKLRAQVGGWIKRAQKTEADVSKLLDTRAIQMDRLCLGGFCSNNLMSSCDYGREVVKMLKEVEHLKSERRDFNVVAVRLPTPTVEKKDIQSKVVGLNSLRQRAWDGLMKDEVRIFGLHGMGGVGKTTLLKHINNNFSLVEKEFDIVIWAEVSQDAPIESIQKQIMRRLGFRDGEWRGKTRVENASDIRNALSGKRFVLLLDDLWSEVDLSEIGVPYPTRENKCKVVFTTRWEEICNVMDANGNMEVKCLSWDDAWDLFQRIVGEMTLKSHPDIPELAVEVAVMCGKLPLALNVIGKAMASRKTVEQWRHAIRGLNSFSYNFPGMKDKIFKILRFSYAHLESEEVKMCFLYCALFPKYCEISKELLIDYWIYEGIIKTKGRGDRDEAVDEGHDIIMTLVSACLLMEDESREMVKMHDVIREMALWIASDCGHYVLEAGEGLRQVPNIRNWEKVRRMSLMYNDIEEIDGDANCPELTTLFLQCNNVRTISGQFFWHMPKLVVLDLSDNRILEELPEEISQLVSLRYLDLSRTRIKQVPVGLQELSKLAYLNIEWTLELEGIGWRISSLRNLQVLRLIGPGACCDLQLLEEIQQLEHLAYLTICVNGDAVGRFLGIRRLTSITRHLQIKSSASSVLVLDPVALGCLRRIRVLDSDMSEIKVDLASRTWLSAPRFRDLSHVGIYSSESLKDLTWLLFAPNLVTLEIDNSWQMEDIINGEKAEAIMNGQPSIMPFEKLEHLTLGALYKLKSIYPSTLPFSNLKSIGIFSCPQLKCLPLDSESAKRGFEGIETDKSWAEGVEWVDDATRQRFLPRLRVVDEETSSSEALM
ncbi:PREDICTED: probable disease resistance protein At1g15890 [Tarenaya hassleriana]|uniref:probable disease resistance protein At1g15890 n=1 Tax=Tarenaya hassleriana TaxID=28532 RepID=UPI00053C0852|nr:PREDICTED: probable disease resistance protein At1g15890 [Tarenaya hassleriana]